MRECCCRLPALQKLTEAENLPSGNENATASTCEMTARKVWIRQNKTLPLMAQIKQICADQAGGSKFLFISAFTETLFSAPPRFQGEIFVQISRARGSFLSLTRGEEKKYSKKLLLDPNRLSGRVATAQAGRREALSKFEATGS